MNILLITHMYPVSDSDKVNTLVIHDLVSAFNGRGEIQVIAVKRDYNPLHCLKGGKPYSFVLDNRIINVVSLFKIPKIPYFKKSKNFISDFICRFIKENKFHPDIIWCESVFDSELGVQIAKKIKAKLVIGFHNTDIRRIEKSFYQGLFKRIFSNADGIIFRSNTMQKTYQKSKWQKIYKNLKYQIIPFGLKQSLTMGIKRQLKRGKIVLCVCSLIRLKKVDVLIRSFKDFLLEQEDYNLLIIGDGPLRKKLEKEAGFLLNRKIHFLGSLPRERVSKIMSVSKIFAMVSSPETFGMVYLEAMGNGCITIGTEKEGIDGIIIDGENGFLIPPNDYQALADTFRFIIKLDQEAQHQLQKRAMLTAQEMSAERVAGLLYKFFENLLLQTE